MAEAWVPFPRMHLASSDASSLRFISTDPAFPQARVEVDSVEPDILRVHLLPYGMADLPRTWGVVGGAGDVGVGGRARDDLSVFTRPALKLEHIDGGVLWKAPAWQLSITFDPFTLTVNRTDGTPVHIDHPEGAYALRPGARGLRHTLRRNVHEVVYGLGEVSGELDRHHRRYRLNPGDALGYNAQYGDPLYKHWPVVFTRTPAGVMGGLLYDSGAEATFDFGSEVDNYLGPYRYAEFAARHLEFYVLLAPTFAGLTRQTQSLLGAMPLPPRWSLGYLGSTMAYTDADDPTRALEGFVEALAAHRIPCTGFHLSSGYSMADDGRRFVFEWNKRRVPDPDAMVNALAHAGIRSVANIKPALLNDHPDHAHLAAAGAFVRDADSDAWYKSRFWGGEAGVLDFTNPVAYAYWVERVRDRILGHGIDATWNDNNEMRILDPEARCAAGAAGDLRPTLTLLMNHASRHAQRAAHPDRRDYQVTRSGGLGAQRYAQTWSGDNLTSWHTLAYNLPMGLSMSVSGWFNHGHDVGGFAGERPSAELLLRWIEAGITQPRFSIHSWNDDGSATEPWTHPEILPQVRALMALRTALVPYLGTLAWGAAHDAIPFTRPLAYAFPDWRPGWREGFVHMLGEGLLIAPVLEPGALVRDTLLPPGRWLVLNSGRVVEGGDRVMLEAPLGSPVWLLREGHALPLADVAHAPQALTPEWLRGGVDAPPPGIDWLVFPDLAGHARGSLVWEDGFSRAYVSGAYDHWTFVSTAATARVRREHAGMSNGVRIHRAWTPTGQTPLAGLASVWSAVEVNAG